MYSYLILLFVLGAGFSNGYVLIESGSGSVSKSEQNPENVEQPLQDIEASVDDSADEEDKKAMQDLEDRFTASLMRVLQDGDELYKDARFDAIINNLKATMLTVTGAVDENYIRKVIESLREKDEANKEQLDEVMMNKLGFSESDFQDFMDQFASDMKKSKPSTTTGSSVKSTFATNE